MAARNKRNSQPATRKAPPSVLHLVPRLLDWFATNARHLPWRRTRDPYAIWVSEIMLQQTQVATVIPYWKRWMQRLPTIESLARARPTTVHKLWEGLGYYTRVRNMRKAARRIVVEHGSRFPQTFDSVLALPGIGRYTAGAICSIAFNQPTPILDGNVIRVLTRLYGIGGDPRNKQTNAQLWQLAQELVDHASRIPLRNSRRHPRTRSRTKDEENRTCSHLNQSLMELGALICTPRQPKCAECPVRRFCVALRTNRVAALPGTERRAAVTQRHFAAFVAQRDGKLFVRQRPEGVVNAHLWEFPNCEVGRIALFDSKRSRGPQLRRLLNLALDGSAARTPQTSLKHFCRIQHSITRYRISLDAYRLEVTDDWCASSSTGRWLRPAQLRRLAFTAAHRKILDAHLRRNGDCPIQKT